MRKLMNNDHAEVKLKDSQLLKTNQITTLKNRVK